jgi:excinuclease UvrABC nuclease subunit
MATHTVPNGVQMMQHRAPDACESFEKASTAFRETVAQVTQIFSQRLASLLQHDEPLLSTEQGYEFETIEDVVEAGEHLEHFHSYQKHDASTTKEETTIDIHVDQGLFLVFSPALLVEDSKILGTLDEGFYVGLEDGSRARAQFNDQDDLVFLLGDGTLLIYLEFLNNVSHDASLIFAV